MKRLITGLGAPLGAAWLIATTSAAQANPAPPIGDAAAVDAGLPLLGAAGAAAPLADFRVVNAGAGIPVGGGILIYSGGGGAVPIVEVTDVATQSTTLGGTLTPLSDGLYWVWVPSAPLTAGNTYQVRMSAPDLGLPGTSTTFDVVAAIPITRPALDSSPSASWHGESSNWASCRTLIGGVLQDATTFPIEQRASIMLEPGFTTSDPAVQINQFVFRVGTSEQPLASAVLTLWPNIVVSRLYNQATEYCFDLEAIDIVSGTVYPYDDIERCAPHGELDDLGTTPIEPGPAELDRVVCHAPPDQYKVQWCHLNEDPCADDGMATGCGLYGFVCEGEPLPPDPFSMMAGAGALAGFDAVGGAGGSDVAGGSTSAGQGGSGMLESDPGGGNANPSDESSGCSVSNVARGAARHHGARAHALWPIALLMLCVSRLYRRRRSRAPR